MRFQENLLLILVIKGKHQQEGQASTGRTSINRLRVKRPVKGYRLQAKKSDPKGPGVKRGLGKNNGRNYSGELSLPFSASLQWLCPSTREEEEVI